MAFKLLFCDLSYTLKIFNLVLKCQINRNFKLAHVYLHMSKFSSKKRARKAYRVAYQITWSYLSLFIRKKLFGKAYYEKRIAALHQKNAERIKTTILSLKGLFTKVGQLLSVMSTILPSEFAKVLESLQDDAPASSFEDTAKTIEKELGEPIDAIFASFDKAPIASASIGQVYRATLKTGEQVAVKIQHPDINELANLDLNIIEKLVKRLAFFLKIQGIEHVYKQVRMMIEEELNYLQEAQSMEIISTNLKGNDHIIIPKTYPAYSSSKIIVCDFHEGVKISNIKQLTAWGIQTETLSKQLIEAFCKMILEDGFYHADPHPGNVLVNKEGQIILLDFGATAKLNDEMRREIPVIIQHIIRKDTPKIIRSLQKMGFLGSDYASQEVAEKLVDALTTFVQNEIKIDNLNIKNVSFDDIKGSSIDRLRKELGLKNLTQTIQVPKDWILLERAILLIHGISATIAPDYNPMQTIKPYLKKLVISEGGLKNLILDTIKQEFAALVQLPSALNQFLDKANRGKLVVETRNKDIAKLYALGHQFMLFISLIVLIFFVNPDANNYANYWHMPSIIILGLLLVLSIRRHKF